MRKNETLLYKLRRYGASNYRNGSNGAYGALTAINITHDRGRAARLHWPHKLTTSGALPLASNSVFTDIVEFREGLNDEMSRSKIGLRTNGEHFKAAEQAKGVLG
jgi:hypothetical protein